MPPTPEAAIKSLARLPPNCICPNCGAHSKYGFSTVCIKYLTFVCNACKSSHQAVSHRCKSLTMSSWDHGEVLQLKTHGNDYARRVWLGNAPAVGTGGRPKEGDDINVFKRFVVEAYEHKKYYREPVDGENGSGGGQQQSNARPNSSVRASGRTITSHAPNAFLQSANSATVNAAPAIPSQQPVKSAPAPAVDLLDFGAFDSEPISSNAPPSNFHFIQHSSNPSAPVASTDPFDPFNINPTVSTSTPAAPPAAANNAAFHMNGSNTTQASSTFAPSSGKASFDPFGAITSNTNSQSTSKVPVMNNFNNGMMNGGIMNNNMMNGGTMNNNPMNGMNHPTMYQNQMQQGVFGVGGGMQSHNMMMMNGINSNGAAMMNGINSNGMAMMNGMNNNNMMMNGNFAGSNNMMLGNGVPMGMAMPISGVGSAMSTTPQPVMAMNMNIMQPMNNSISTNFSAKPATSESNKEDPFAGLGF
ncbi:hypothetical protein HJC23_011736 [Cyclotella cryptica]|uniref:Arf-GAP domain-containing protein n=1 Tax=Cyclotella cryptica TaxID=29204 RepID=A0ABD3NJY0_9STRA|eukprot:CCRYP_020718-RA/>CCRYP_020718-RA protein AED:0.12 eAED:0.12 QI:0/-1/0/1/-1/1/1/0/471